MIIKRITTLISSTLGSNLAAVGHIIAENDPDKTRKVFTEYNALFFFIAGVFAFVLYFITDPFISLWLGREFVLPKLIFLLILAEAYITITRQAVMVIETFYKKWSNNKHLYILTQ